MSDAMMVEVADAQFEEDRRTSQAWCEKRNGERKKRIEATVTGWARGKKMAGQSIF